MLYCLWHLGFYRHRKVMWYCLIFYQPFFIVDCIIVATLFSLIWANIVLHKKYSCRWELLFIFIFLHLFWLHWIKVSCFCIACVFYGQFQCFSFVACDIDHCKFFYWQYFFLVCSLLGFLFIVGISYIFTGKGAYLPLSS